MREKLNWKHVCAVWKIIISRFMVTSQRVNRRNSCVHGVCNRVLWLELCSLNIGFSVFLVCCCMVFLWFQLFRKLTIFCVCCAFSNTIIIYEWKYLHKSHFFYYNAPLASSFIITIIFGLWPHYNTYMSSRSNIEKINMNTRPNFHRMWSHDSWLLTFRSK